MISFVEMEKGCYVLYFLIMQDLSDVSDQILRNTWIKKPSTLDATS